MNAYLQRADDFIQQKIYEYEQRKLGRNYTEINQRQHQPYHQPPRTQTFHNPPPLQGPPAPNGWIQQFDPNSRRWYYVERATGHSQWHPPSPNPHHSAHRHTLSHCRQPSSSTFDDKQMAQRLQEEEHQNRPRNSAQPSRPHPGQLGVPQQMQQQRPNNISPHPSPYGRLPPGAHLDMRTGEIVYNIYPRDHPLNAR